MNVTGGSEVIARSQILPEAASCFGTREKAVNWSIKIHPSPRIP